MSRGISISIVSDYEMDDQGSNLGIGRELFLYLVFWPALGVPAFYSMGTGDPFPGV